MKRLSLAIAAMSCLTGAYHVYARWFDSITALERPIPVAVLPKPGERPVQPPNLQETALEELPDQDWAPHAKFAFERGDHVFLYTDSVDWLTGEGEPGDRVRFAPFAMVVSDPDDPSAVPFVIRCESARIRFENPFRLEFGAPRPGRLVGGTLEGAVAITGPDGLELYGQNFVFSEEAAHLYSDYPVEFAFGAGSGTGRQSGSARQLEIDLIPSHDSVLGRDGPRVGGISRIALRRDVQLNLTYEQNGEPRKVAISSRGIFEYDVASRIATFEDDVVVVHPTSPGQADTLRCDWLALQFEETADESSLRLAGIDVARNDASVDTVSGNSTDDGQAGHPFANLQFRQLRAVGDRAVLKSDENQLLARMHELRYDSVTRRVLLLDDEAVRIQYDLTELASRDLELFHDEHGEVVSVECRGAGELEQFPATDEPALFRAFWDDHLHYGYHTETQLWLIQVAGRARVVQAGAVGIEADQLALWVDPEAAEQYSDRNSASVTPVPNAAARELPIRYAQAEGSVVMASPEFRIETQRLQARFLPDLARLPEHTQSSATLPEADSGSNEIWMLSANDVQVQVLHDLASGESQLAEATAAGEIQISRRAPDGSPASDEQSVSIAGEALHLEHRGGTGELLTLTGEPAHIRRGDMHLEARDIVFDRRENTAHVEGRGMLRFPVSADLNGNRLDDPVPLDVHWQEQMTFDGRQAQFFGNVVLKLNDGRVNESRLYCEDLNVLLNEFVSFTQPQPESQELQFTRVTCRDGVRTELYEWEGTRLSGIRVFELAEFTLEHDTGLLEGLGPGVISSWTRGTDRRISIAPEASAEANQPAESDRLEWEYTQVHFSRNMTGNAHQRTVELHGHVSAIYAPVQHPREVFLRDELDSDLPNAGDAVWLGCDELAIGLHPWESRPDEDYAVFGATGHCELEGQLFRAVADLISFDQSKELFTLKGLGDRKASIYHQRNPGDHPQRLSAQLIQFIPSKQRISLQGASGFQTSP